MTTKKQEQLTYYNGFSDGVHVCNMAVIAMGNAILKETDMKNIKAVVALTMKTLAEISDETNDKLDHLLMVKED